MANRRVEWKIRCLAKKFPFPEERGTPSTLHATPKLARHAVVHQGRRNENGRCAVFFNGERGVRVSHDS